MTKKTADTSVSDTSNSATDEPMDEREKKVEAEALAPETQLPFPDHTAVDDGIIPSSSDPTKDQNDDDQEKKPGKDKNEDKEFDDENNYKEETVSKEIDFERDIIARDPLGKENQVMKEPDQDQKGKDPPAPMDTPPESGNNQSPPETEQAAVGVPEVPSTATSRPCPTAAAAASPTSILRAPRIARGENLAADKIKKWVTSQNNQKRASAAQAQLLASNTSTTTTTAAAAVVKPAPPTPAPSVTTTTTTTIITTTTSTMTNSSAATTTSAVARAAKSTETLPALTAGMGSPTPPIRRKRQVASKTVRGSVSKLSLIPIDAPKLSSPPVDRYLDEYPNDHFVLEDHQEEPITSRNSSLADQEDRGVSSKANQAPNVVSFITSPGKAEGNGESAASRTPPNKVSPSKDLSITPLSSGRPKGSTSVNPSKRPSESSKMDKATSATKKKRASPSAKPGMGDGKPGSAEKKPRHGNPEVFVGEPTESLEGGWPPGWIKRGFQRQTGKQAGHIDYYWYSPQLRHKLRSMAEVRRYVACLAACQGDETAAWGQFKRKS